MNRKLLYPLVILLTLSLPACVIYVDESGEADFHLGTAKVKADQTLADLVAGEMQGDELLSQEDITVHAKGGTVILKGTVEDVAVLDRAIKVAVGTEGVTTVKSRLEVEIKN